jgi:hypothetical protein
VRVTKAWAVTRPVIAFPVMAVAAHRRLDGWRLPGLAAAAVHVGS